MKAIILLSGGLDSTLAAEIMNRNGLELVAVNYKTPFCLCDSHSKGGGCASNARRVTDALGIELRMINATDDFLQVLRDPKHGYGANMNPCIDCRILFFKKSKAIMAEVGASFVITGEVLGQRPMSQHKRQLAIIEKESGLEELVVRPLSEKLLPPTIPERNGWINREGLLSIEGRSRKQQISIAKELGVKDYPCAAGGCLLTYSGFAKKIKDLISHDELDLSNIHLLRSGRYFRLSKQAKLIIGRNEQDNAVLERLAQDGDHIFYPSNINGPFALGRGLFSHELIELSCGIVARYCDRDGQREAEVCYRKHSDAKASAMVVSALSDVEINKRRI